MKPKAPMLVMRTIHNTGMESRELMAVHAFAHGFATTEHFDLLTYMMNIMLLAGSTSKKRKYAEKYAEKKVKPVITSIRDRYIKTGKLGVAGIELEVLREFVEFNKQFWLRQPSELFATACAEVDAFFTECSEKRAA